MEPVAKLVPAKTAKAPGRLNHKQHRAEALAWLNHLYDTRLDFLLGLWRGNGGRSGGCTAEADSKIANALSDFAASWPKDSLVQAPDFINERDWVAFRHLHGWKEYTKGPKGAPPEGPAAGHRDPALAPVAPAPSPGGAGDVVLNRSLAEAVIQQAGMPLRVRRRGWHVYLDLGEVTILTIDLGALRRAQLQLGLGLD
jgi:hypothetical protein